jgi:hypothetical protein
LSALLREDPAAAVWWATPVECGSALARLEREQRLNEAGSRVAWERLVEAGRSWTEVPPLERVREQAIRVLQLHPLRAADALQLAAAIVLADFDPKTLPFVTLDQALATAARREGFPVLGA